MAINSDLYIGNWVFLEKVHKFCYHRDMLDADECDLAVRLDVHVWNKFREYK